MSSIQAKPKSIFSWSFDLFVDHELLTTMDMRWFKEGGLFHWNDCEYRLGRENLWSGDFFLNKDERQIAKATKTSPFARKFILKLTAGELVLSAVHPLTRVFHLTDGNNVIGIIKPDHILTRQCTIQLPDTLCVPEQVFIFWLVVLMWRRSTNSNN